MLDTFPVAQVVLISDVINNDSHGSSRYMAPYSLASQLRHLGYDVVVIDYFSQLESPVKYLLNFIGPETIAIGISSTFLNPTFRPNYVWRGAFDDSNFYYDNDLFFHEAAELDKWVVNLKKEVRSVAPRARVILGGAKAARALEKPEGYRSFDYICIGAGDRVFIDTVNRLRAGEAPIFVVRNGVHFLTAKHLKNATNLCPEAYWLPQDAVQLEESLPIEVSRGCVFNCKFCNYEKKNSVRKSIDVLRGELIRNYENFGVRVYHLTDDCFNDNREKVMQICEMFIQLPFQMEWIAYSRVDLAVRFPETLDIMIRSGARGLHWGIESLNDEASRRAGKGTPTEKVKKLLLEFQSKYGDKCISTGSFITGLPGESRKSIENTIDWVCENDALHSLVVSPLVITKYSQSLDQSVIDYADYSRNPEKYGFRSVRFGPDYWEHDQMNSDMAKELAIKFQRRWTETKGMGPIRTMWRYPHMRSLGFKHDEIMSRLRPSADEAEFLRESKARFKNFCGRYHERLLSSCKRGGASIGESMNREVR